MAIFPCHDPVSVTQNTHVIFMRKICLLLVLLPPLFAQAAPPVPLAALGDSDTHGYRDHINFPNPISHRGGKYFQTTHQWTEVLSMLRSGEIDLGAPTVTGTRGRIARALAWVGINARSPRKFDHLYNFAFSGAGCEDLWEGSRQVPQLLSLMKTNPNYWTNGVVTVRIGVKNFGQRPELARLVANPADPQVHAQISTCITELTKSAQAIRAQHPHTAIVLVGIFNNANLAYSHDQWRNPNQLAGIDVALDRFDHALKALVATDKRMAFFDDRAWFASVWGTRDANGQPAYRSLDVGVGLRVTNTIGDPPNNAVLQDNHAGTAFNAKWAQAIVQLLNSKFGMAITPISDAEVARVVAPSGQWPEP
jgi:hypothetical protein